MHCIIISPRENQLFGIMTPNYFYLSRKVSLSSLLTSLPPLSMPVSGPSHQQRSLVAKVRTYTGPHRRGIQTLQQPSKTTCGSTSTQCYASICLLHQAHVPPLTKPKFLERVNNTTHAASLDPLQGHGIRIGSTLEYLLQGIPFDVMKVKGCWARNTFLLYLQKHAIIITPYI